MTGNDQSDYFTENGVKADVLEKIVKSYLVYLKESGLELLGVVCDQSTMNQKCFRLMGITAEMP